MGRVASTSDEGTNETRPKGQRHEEVPHPRFYLTVCTIIDDLDDVVTLLNDKEGIREIQAHDKVVISVGQYDILHVEGHWNGRAAKLLVQFLMS